MTAIQDWHQNDSYNLYMSESRGLFFTLMLENVVSSGGPEGNIMIDLYEVGSAVIRLHVPRLFRQVEQDQPSFVTAAIMLQLDHVSCLSKYHSMISLSSSTLLLLTSVLLWVVYIFSKFDLLLKPVSELVINQIKIHKQKC